MNTIPSTARGRWYKLWRYIRIYGWRRALVKAAGRTRSSSSWMLGLKRRAGPPNVSVIGCRQAAFSTLCFFLYRARGAVFLDAFDTDRVQAETLARFYGFRGVAESADILLQDPAVRLVYIASNHASHTAYTIEALQRSVDVFVEKPLCTQWKDLRALEEAIEGSRARIWTGYNRPFSAAVVHLRKKIAGLRTPLSLVCYIHGHHIPQAHWYRHPKEGTRISGNAGHWLDLAIHLLTAVWGGAPSIVHLHHTPATAAEPDDNFTLILHTDAGDHITIVLASRNEPAEGVRESIEVQCGEISAQIDDFRTMRLWHRGKSSRTTYPVKDVGHRLCTLQPFLPDSQQRSFTEVLCSTRLMLHATDLARRGGGSYSADLTHTPVPVSFNAE